MEMDVEKLLRLIEARTPLYNHKDVDHTNKSFTDNLWREVATIMKCNVSDCKKKWTGLRNSYCRNLREEITKPTGLMGKKRKKWYLAPAMAFLKDYVHPYRKSNDVDIWAVDPLYESESDTSTASYSPVEAKRCKTPAVEIPTIDSIQSSTIEKIPDNANSLFFKSLLAEFEKLSSKRQRLYKMQMLTKMHEMQDEEENDLI